MIDNLVKRLRDAHDGWSGDACCVSAEVAAEGADEIERLRNALQATQGQIMNAKIDLQTVCFPYTD